jgi:uncharacterized protein (UPF0332 family)
MFDWKDYLKLSKHLKDNPIDNLEEASYRSSISRSYYSVYCIARNQLVNKKSLTIPKKDSHKFVIEEYEKSNNNKEKQIGANLKRLKTERIKADYHDNYNDNRAMNIKNAKTACLNAENTLKLLDNL